MGFMRYVREQIDVIKERDPAIKTPMEVFLYPCFWAILSYRVAHKLYLKKHYFWARWISQRAARKTGIEIHPGAQIGKRLFIDHGHGVIIGETAVVGDNVTMFQGVTLGGNGKEKGKAPSDDRGQRHDQRGGQGARLFYDRREFQDRRRERGAGARGAEFDGGRRAGQKCEAQQCASAQAGYGSGYTAGSCARGYPSAEAGESGTETGTGKVKGNAPGAAL